MQMPWCMNSWWCPWHQKRIILCDAMMYDILVVLSDLTLNQAFRQTCLGPGIAYLCWFTTGARHVRMSFIRPFAMPLSMQDISHMHTHTHCTFSQYNSLPHTTPWFQFLVERVCNILLLWSPSQVLTVCKQLCSLRLSSTLPDYIAY